MSCETVQGAEKSFVARPQKPSRTRAFGAIFAQKWRLKWLVVMILRQMVLVLAGMFLSLPLLAQYQQEPQAEDSTVVLTLDDALKIALSENVSVKVADMEIQRAKYAKKGSYGALLPQINASGLYSYAIQKQKVYFGSDKASDDEGESKGGGMASMMGAMMDPIYYYIQQLMALHPTAQIPPYQAPQQEESSSGSDAVEMGRSNQVQFGISASMPLVNVQLWESLRRINKKARPAVPGVRERRPGLQEVRVVAALPRNPALVQYYHIRKKYVCI